MKRLIIDCDPGHDDAIALILAHHVADVAGITTVSGNAPLAATTENALLVTALLDVETPVHAGAAGPLVGAPIHAAMVHGESGLGTVDRIPHTRTVASDDAVGYLLEAAAEDVWIVAIGPLTNLALALERDPSWANRVAGIAIMGGSAGIGNATPVAEFNIYADPEAAARVFESGAEVVMCGPQPDPPVPHRRCAWRARARRRRASRPSRRPDIRRHPRPHGVADRQPRRRPA